MGNTEKPKIGEPPGQRPLTTAAVNHLRSISRSAADDILALPRVCDWVAAAGDADLQDRRACSLVTACSNFLANAKLPWKTPTEHQKHYLNLAKKLRGLGDATAALSRAADAEDLQDPRSGSRAIVKLSELRDVPSALSLAADTAEPFACNHEGFTNPRPHHDNAPRNDFIRALSTWFRGFSGAPMYELTADITNALFPCCPDKLVTAQKVDRLQRK